MSEDEYWEKKIKQLERLKLNIIKTAISLNAGLIVGMIIRAIRE